MDYSEEYFEDKKRTGFRFTNNSKRFYYSRVLRIINKYHKTGTHLDVGCGQGKMVAFASKYYSSQGIDISPEAIDYAKKNYKQKFECASLEQLEKLYQKKSFNIITAIDVLEHIKEPDKTIRDIHSLLKIKGLLVISVPNTKSLGRRIKKEKWFALRDKTHVSLLEPETWINLLQENGFTIVMKKTDGLWDSPYMIWLPEMLQHVLFKFSFNVLFYIGLLPSSNGENLVILGLKK